MLVRFTFSKGYDYFNFVYMSYSSVFFIDLLIYLFCYRMLVCCILCLCLVKFPGNASEGTGKILPPPPLPKK